MNVSKLLGVGAIAALLAACSGNGTQSLPSAPSQPPTAGGDTIQSRTMVEDGVTMRVLPARGVTVLDDYNAGTQILSNGRAGTSSNLLYNGGPIQQTPHIFVVYWGPKWSTGNEEYKTLNGFFGAIGGHGWINTDTQYYMTSGGSKTYITNPSGQLTSTWIDTSSIPSKPSSSQVGAEAQRAEQHFAAAGYGYSVNNSYIVALQSGSDPSGFKHQWCAWHSSESEPEGTISYTDFPYQSDAGYSCGAGSVNTPGTYDGVSIVGGHEEAETQTDPQPNTGWLDSGGSENGDKCAWTNLEDNPNAGNYPTQPLWDNKTSACEQSGP